MGEGGGQKGLTENEVVLLNFSVPDLLVEGVLAVVYVSVDAEIGQAVHNLQSIVFLPTREITRIRHEGIVNVSPALTNGAATGITKT